MAVKAACLYVAPRPNGFKKWDFVSRGPLKIHKIFKKNPFFSSRVYFSYLRDAESNPAGPEALRHF